MTTTMSFKLTTQNPPFILMFPCTVDYGYLEHFVRSPSHLALDQCKKLWVSQNSISRICIPSPSPKINFFQ